MTSVTNTDSMINQIIAGISCYWRFVQSTMIANLLTLATTSNLTINDWQITNIERTATALGSNGLPIAAVTIQYDKNETTQHQTDLSGSVSTARMSYLMTQYRQSLLTNSGTITRHPLATSINIQSNLRNASDAIAAATRLLNIATTRVDIVSITAIVTTIPTITIGAGVTIYTPKLAYSAGKLLTIIGYQMDAKKKSITLECIG
jgi:hypothetical protein